MPRSSLIVIDMQNDFLDKLEEARRTELIERTNELIGIFRATGNPVIWVTTVFSPDLGDAFLEMRDHRIAVAIRDTAGAAVDARLLQYRDDPVVVKKRYSAFFDTDLDSLLAGSGAEYVAFAGVNTHACVRTTAIDAYQRDMRVWLARDCIDSFDKEHAAVSMAYMDRKIGVAVSNEEIRQSLA